jgi:hypothetical protein
VREIALELKLRIENLDTLCFPERNLPVVLRDRPPFYGEPQIALAHCPGDISRDEYRICVGNIDTYIEASLPYHIHVMLEQADPALEKKMVPFTKKETLLTLALHEVRHRVQYHNKIEIISPIHTKQIFRCNFWGKVQEEHYRNVPGGAQEFDALFISHYGAYEFRQGRLASDEAVRKILLMTPGEFLNRERQK